MLWVGLWVGFVTDFCFRARDMLMRNQQPNQNSILMARDGIELQEGIEIVLDDSGFDVVLADEEVLRRT